MGKSTSKLIVAVGRLQGFCGYLTEFPLSLLTDKQGLLSALRRLYTFLVVSPPPSLGQTW